MTKHEISTVADRIHAVVTDSRDTILALLGEMVGCNSFTHNKPGIDRVGDIVADAMPARFSHELIRRESVGNHHCFRHELSGRLPILLVGHLDTLCPQDPAWNRLTVQGDRLLGPGVNDMKSGDVTIICALKALERLGLLDALPIVCLFNGDEETGSPDSHPLFTAMRDKARAALVYECGGPEGTVVTTRKGICRYRLRATGQAAHFGNLKGRKVSAVEEVAHKVLAVEAFTRADGAVVANVGRVAGGLLANCVPAEALMEFEVRYWDPAREAEVQQSVEALAVNAVVPGCKLALERLSYRPVMQPDAASRTLFDLTVRTAESLGQRIVEEKRGGVSDACWLRHAGLPTLDGLGPCGDKDHTPEEYIFTESLFERIELTANLLLALNNGA